MTVSVHRGNKRIVSERSVKREIYQSEFSLSGMRRQANEGY